MLLAGMLGMALIVLGLWVIYFYVSTEEVDNSKAFMLMSFASFLMVAGVFLISTDISIQTISRKIYGFMIMLLGAYLGVGFPDMSDYHPKQFDMLPMFIGFILMAIGVYLLVF